MPEFDPLLEVEYVNFEKFKFKDAKKGVIYQAPDCACLSVRGVVARVKTLSVARPVFSVLIRRNRGPDTSVIKGGCVGNMGGEGVTLLQALAPSAQGFALATRAFEPGDLSRASRGLQSVLPFSL